MTGTLSEKFKTYLRLLAPLVLLVAPVQLLRPARAQGQATKQHFVCNVGYTSQECAVDMAVLRRALAKYPVEALEDWTWVLVRPEDWKRILLDRGFDPNNPAFSYLPARETFLDGALVAKVSSRGVELSELWHMSVEDLLDLAVRHELGHALCNEKGEAKADRVARLLHTGQAPTCEVQLAASSSRQPKGQR
jgi:hypothetical protein